MSMQTQQGLHQRVVTTLSVNIVEIEEPTNMEGTLQSSHSQQWKTAADAEYNSIKNKTWELMELPCDQKTVGCEWVFKV